MPRDNERVKYDHSWDWAIDDAQIENWYIQQGPEDVLQRGRTLFTHYKALFRLYWPEDDEHRWEDAILHAILDSDFTTLMGPGSAAKTYTAAKFALVDYAAFPETTGIMISSTDLRGLEMRIWGTLKSLWQRAADRFDWFPGHVLDSKHAITTDDIGEGGAVRDMRKGILCVPTKTAAGQQIGLARLVGFKNKRLRLISDEVQFLDSTFLDITPNFMQGCHFKAVYIGNPLAQNDSLDKAAEPVGGWPSVGVPTKTTTWRTRFMNGLCLNLVGSDSPNNDFPNLKYDRYPYLTSKRKAALVAMSYGENSSQFYCQCMGVRIQGLTARKVITKELCEKFSAFKAVVWKGTPLVKVYAVDAAYGGVGGDRCVGMALEFGTDIDGRTVISVANYTIIPVTVNMSMPPDDQIALYVRSQAEMMGIPPSNIFFDGRTSLATSFAREWSAEVTPVDFGGKPTHRPVCQDMYIQDPQTKQRRLMLCSERYSKFVSELWMTVRYTVEASQLRNLPLEVLEDGEPREYKTVSGNRIEIETKAEMKKRTGRSPDLFDALATGLEGARRLGFQISSMLNSDAPEKDLSWLHEINRQARDFQQSHNLTYS